MTTVSHLRKAALAAADEGTGAAVEPADGPIGPPGPRPRWWRGAP
ncbi:hypothetical protein [Nocardiopsis sp. CA-288880]